jgi:ATP-dependent RNA helicase DDX51/DBP6
MASASGVYLRYIPPKKAKAPEINVIEDPPAPPPIKSSASNTYSRYIPPPKSKSHDDSNITTTKRKREAEPELELPKKTKRVKEKKHVKPEPAPSDATSIEVHLEKREKKKHEEFESATKHDIVDDSSKQERNKKKKRKHAGPESAIEDDTPAEDDSKYKKVMERREKSLKKAEKLAKKEAKKAANETKGKVQEEEDIPEEPVELHDLVPLPQPEPVLELPLQSLTSSLPPWLANPIRVEPTATAGLLDLGIQKEAAKILQAKGFKEAFAVQAAVLPLLLPGKSQTPGDVLVSAATGSGKTLSYVLPMIEDISQHCVTRLRGLVVMPTRELVSQAKEVCEICASAFFDGDRKRVKIGTAVGNESFKVEQTLIMEQEDRYDPEAKEAQEARLNRKWESSSWESGEDDDDILCDDEPISRLPDHVIDHISRVDILVCTPGRLVEHLKLTPGFTLEYIRWLVVDEADKLLDQTYQNWLNIVIGRLPPPKQRNRVRKCVLSATITKNVGQLAGLKLHRPKLVVLEGQVSHDSSYIQEGHVLPAQLLESGVKIEEDNLKPLYLMELLSREDMVPKPLTSDDTSSDSDSSSDSDASSDESSEESSKSSPEPKFHNVPTNIKQSDTPHGVLIFTKSNETAVRLGRLIALLEPKYSNLIGKLTSTTRSSSRKSTITSFNTSRLSILVASDLVSRGLDLSNLAHVVNYDMPTSVTNYVHRVGRTARAGKKGYAWTLFTGTEARWFWNEIGRSEAIQRKEGERITRVTIKVEVFDEELKRRYEDALEELGKEAASAGKVGKGKK